MNEVYHRQLDLFLLSLPVLPYGGECARHYGEIRRHLEVSGTPIGAMDLLIAAHARAAGLVMVTHNIREFDRMPGLVVEDWAVG
ncbi:PIN domain-containing protein [Haloferula chungangensis]|uniref:PIN domain-containing protein n=1 Tax=Haloferula chungangensis TaxID=1048331 RepID=A0ABW2LCH7_9BACT